MLFTYVCIKVQCGNLRAVQKILTTWVARTDNAWINRERREMYVGFFVGKRGHLEDLALDLNKRHRILKTWLNCLSTEASSRLF